MKGINCPKCQGSQIVKSGIVKGRQRFQCKSCHYFFTVMKDGKKIEAYYVIKALQLFIEGVSLREIERLIGISHVSVLNWVKKYKITAPENNDYHPTYKVLKHTELLDYLADREQIKDSGIIISELGDKYMLIKWEKFKK